MSMREPTWSTVEAMTSGWSGVRAHPSSFGMPPRSVRR
jgi:hypothetical protein